MKRLTFLIVALGACALACSSSPSPSTSSTSDSGATGTDPDGGAGADDGSAPTADAAPAPFALTSGTLTEGGTFPKESTCNATPASAQVSPPFSWTAGPAGTKSYALVMLDTNNGLTHGATYDIPATALELPKGVERKYQPAVPAGAKQTKAYDGQFGYAGPCPPTGEHLYQFTLYALGVDALPNMTQNTSAKDCDTEAKKHVLGSVKLTAKYKQ